MKKVLSIACFVAILSLLPFCFAESDTQAAIHEFFSDSSIEELVAFKNMIEFELEYRGYSSEKNEPKEFDVPVGKYTIGIDIPAGIYTVSRGSGMFDSIVVIGNYESFYPVSQNSPIGKLELVEGQTIEVQMGGVKFSEYTGIGF